LPSKFWTGYATGCGVSIMLKIYLGGHDHLAPPGYTYDHNVS